MDKRIIDTYDVSDNYVLRTPIYHFNFQSEVLGNILNISYLSSLLTNDFILESIYLASPALAKTLRSRKFLNKPYSKKNEKVLYGLVKYLLRLSTRSTPFGIFSGISTGTFKEKTSIIRSGNLDFYRKTTLDASLYLALKRHLLADKKNWSTIRWFSNSSIYINSDVIRYLEKNDLKKEFSIQSTMYNDEIFSLISYAKRGAYISDLIGILERSGYSRNQSREYIHTLIENGIFFSELEPSVYDTMGIEKIINICQKIGDSSTFFSFLKSLQKKVRTLDNSKISGLDTYNEISGLISKSLGNRSKIVLTPFMVDVFPIYESNTLKITKKAQLKKAFEVTRYFSPNGKNVDYSNFVELFRSYYGSCPVRLVDAMDIDYGIGYPVNCQIDDNDYINSFNLKKTGEKLGQESGFSDAHELLRKKLNARNYNENILKITDGDLKDLNYSYNNLAKTFFGLFEFMEVDKIDFVHPISFGSSSAATLNSRFGFSNYKITDLLQEITSVEKCVCKDTVYVEVAHTQLDRGKNVSKRPIQREFTLSYLDGPSSLKENTIDIDDLYLVFDNDALLLKSKSLDKNVIPYLTTASDYTKSTLPIYRFLGDFQFKEERPYYYFSWGILKDKFITLPRVIYENIVLSKALWRFFKPDVEFLISLLQNEELFDKRFQNWKIEQNLPRYVQLIGNTGKLLVDLENMFSVRMLISIIKSDSMFELEEYLQSSNPLVVNRDNQAYSSEFVFSFQKIRIQKDD